MFFKFLRLTLPVVLPVLLIFQVGCSKEDEKLISPKPMAAVNEKTICLNKSIGILQNYFSGTANENEVDYFWDCTKIAIDLFMQHTRGARYEAYSSQELRNFIEGDLLHEAHLSDRFLHSAMRVKQMFLGGTVQYVSRKELLQSLSLLDVFRDYTKRILFFTRVFNVQNRHLNPLNQLSILRSNDFERVKKEFSFIANDLAARLASQNQIYQFEELQELLMGIGDLYHNRSGVDHWSSPENLAQKVPFFASLKEALIAQGRYIEPRDWNKILNMGVKLLVPLLRYDYYMAPVQPGQDFQWQGGAALENLEQAGLEIFDLLESRILDLPDESIPYQNISAILLEMKSAGYIPEKIRVSTLQGLLHLMFEKWPVGLQNKNRGLSLEVLRFYQNLFKALILNQKFIQDAYKNPQWSKDNPQYQIIAIQDLKDFLKGNFLIELDQGGHALLPNPQNKTNFHSASLLNLTYTVLDFLLNAYNPEAKGSISERALNAKQTQSLYQDVLPFASEIGFLDPKKPELWRKLIAESNLFMPSADGNEFLSLKEGVEYYLLVTSAKAMARDFVQDFANLQCQRDDKNQYLLACARNALKGNLPKYAVGMTQFSQFFQTQSEDEKLDTITFAMRAAFSDKQSYASEADFGAMFMAMQYMEVTFSIFDENRDGFINLEESLKAFPRFREGLARVSGLTDEKDLQAVLTYLLAHGERPSKAEFIWWRYVKSWSFNADRNRVLQILGNF